MAIGTPVSLATPLEAAATNTSTVLTTTTGHNAGDKIVVTFHCSLGLTITSVTDSAGNSYTVWVTGTTSRFVAIASSDGANALGSGGTITVNYASTGGSKKLAAWSVSGLAPGSDVVAADATGSVAAWSSAATGTLTSANEIVFGATSRGGGASVTELPGTNWTEIMDLNGNSFNGAAVYQIVTSSASVTPNGTWSATGTAWDAIGVSFKAAAAAPADAPTGSLTLAGSVVESQTLNDQLLRPASDVATAGWSTAPLFSKINDSSDGTFITATLA